MIFVYGLLFFLAGISLLSLCIGGYEDILGLVATLMAFVGMIMMIGSVLYFAMRPVIQWLT